MRTMVRQGEYFSKNANKSETLAIDIQDYEIVLSRTLTSTLLPVWLTRFSSQYAVSYPILFVKLLQKLNL